MTINVIPVKTGIQVWGGGTKNSSPLAYPA